MSIVCLRGDTELNEQDLRAHLVAMLRLENTAVLLGAGASVPSGGMTIMQLWKQFIRDHADTAKRFADGGFIAQEDAVLASFEAANPRNLPNIEALLDQLEMAKLDWTRRLASSRNLKIFKKDIEALLKCVVKAAVLDANAWGKPPAYDRFPYHVKLLQRLVGARQPGQASPWVFTTNYDLAVEWAAESIGIHTHTGFVGIHNRTFSPQSFDLGYRNINAKGEARFGCNDIYLAKLHGSLTWQCTDGEYRELASSEVWPKLKAIIDGVDAVDETLMVFPRAAKYLQTVGFLSGELFRRFSDFLAKPQSCIILAGYSFGDDHINRLLRSALLNPTLQIIAFLPEFMGTEPAELAGLKPEVRRLLALKSPRLTFVGGGEAAYFNHMVDLLPDPMLYDLNEQEFRERIKAMSGGDDAE
ncbi:SIR2 family anti-phage-associated protein [Achromobacter sp. F4_2707]|uniref:SIR2 family anti-phage-associated protein n=1 Tax=Achromobacter sp. F4_2707 TaxID=3114286 RepID=UPI0039C6021E